MYNSFIDTSINGSKMNELIRALFRRYCIYSS